MLSLAISPWLVKATDRCHRTFIWHGTDVVMRGHCLEAWGRVHAPFEYGSIASSSSSSWVCFLHCMDPSITWVSLPMHHERAIQEMFHAASRAVVRSWAADLFLDGPLDWWHADEVHCPVPLNNNQVLDRCHRNFCPEPAGYLLGQSGTLTMPILVENLMLWIRVRHYSYF
jgi:hypothetical protein